jgi:hypothetical protein
MTGFELNIDPEDVPTMVSHVFEARLLLEDLYVKTQDERIRATLDEADARLAHTGPALLWLDQDWYEELIEGRTLDLTRWWGWREANPKHAPGY